jgi:hypothetical protein
MAAQGQKRVIGAEGLTDGSNRRRDGEQIGQESDGDEQCRAHQPYATPHPPHGGRQRDRVGAETIGGRFHARRHLGSGNHYFDSVEVARETARETIRQEAEGFMRRRAVVSRNPHPGWPLPSVRAVSGEATSAARVARAHRQTCVGPPMLGNIGFAGQWCLVA